MAKLKTVIELDYLLANTKKKKKSVNGRYMNTPPQKKKKEKKRTLGIDYVLSLSCSLYLLNRIFFSLLATLQFLLLMNSLVSLF